MKTLEALTKQIVIDRLCLFKGNIMQTSNSLGVSDTSLHRWLKLWHVDLDHLRKHPNEWLMPQ